jgi:hypothetical protein
MPKTPFTLIAAGFFTRDPAEGRLMIVGAGRFDVLGQIAPNDLSFNPRNLGGALPPSTARLSMIGPSSRVADSPCLTC